MPKSKIIINKFGGGIMVKKHIPYAEKRIAEQLKSGARPVVVVSALKGTTDQFIAFLHLLKEKVRNNQRKGVSSEKYINNLIRPFVARLSKEHLGLLEEIGVSREWRNKARKDLDQIFSHLENDLTTLLNFGFSNIFDDKVVSYGEKLSSVFFAYYLKSLGIKARAIMAEDIPIITDDSYCDANINFKVSEKNARKKLLKLKEVPVIPGFTGETPDGNTATLGRGGTDTTACFLGAALRAKKIILWKDVEGVLSADPRIVPSAQTVPLVSYAEAAESGKVIHDKAIQFVKIFKTPTEVAFIANPGKKTAIVPYSQKQKGAKIVSYKKNLSLLVITDDAMNECGYLANTARILADHKINLDVIRTTRDQIQIVVENNNGLLDEAIGELKKEVKKLRVAPVTMVILIGMLNWRIVNRFNELLLEFCPDAELGAFPYRDSVRLEAIVKPGDAEKMIKVLHKEFIK